MDDSTTARPLPSEIHDERPDGITLWRWFVIFALWLATLGVPIALLLTDIGRPGKLFVDPAEYTQPMHQVLKLLIYTFYLSLCCTFLPLPTSGMVAAMATSHVAVTGQMWSTVLLVAGCGAAGSTMANLNDYHLFTLLLRHRGVAKIRRTKTYAAARKWFQRSPFGILLVANILPIPIDVIRMLAITSRYPRGPFAAANYIGRFIRYALLAGVIYLVGERYQVHAVIGIFVFATLLALGRLVRGRMRKGPPPQAILPEETITKDVNHE